jgi:hypothetical protein
LEQVKPPHALENMGKYCGESPISRSRLSTKESCRGAEDVTSHAGSSSAGAAQPAVQDRVGDDEELEVAFHGAHVSYLQNLKEAIEDNEFKEALKQHATAADDDSSKIMGTGQGNIDAAHLARAARLANIFRARQEKKEAKAAERREKAAAALSSASRFSWGEESEEAAQVQNATAESADRNLSMWWKERWDSEDNPWDSEYFGRGYGLKVSNFVASKSLANSIAALSGASYSCGADKRRLHREQAELRQCERELKLEEGDIQYLAFESFHDFRDAKSGVVSEDVYSVVDSGTTVTIKRDDGMLMHQFDPRATIRIMGFNGSLSKSKGKGILVGYATAKSGKRVET